jgi:hypothetical protein
MLLFTNNLLKKKIFPGTSVSPKAAGYIQKLLNYIHGEFNKEPDSFVALRLRHTSDAFSWRVSGRVLTLYDNGNILHEIDLQAGNLGALVDYLATLPGFTVIYADADRMGISACALIEDTGYQAQSNGDIIRAYQSPLWAFLDAVSTELYEAKTRIDAMLDQMSILNADDDWLEEWGGYFGIKRQIGESDTNYGNRIIAEVIRPRGNNKAIEDALLRRYGQSSSVENIIRWGDAVPRFNGDYVFDGSWTFNATATPIYGLFKIVIGYDLLNSGDPPAFIQSVRDYVETLRDAGTHLDSVELSSSTINDDCAAPADGECSLTITEIPHFNGLRTFDGSWTFGQIETTELI